MTVEELRLEVLRLLAENSTLRNRIRQMEWQSSHPTELRMARERAVRDRELGDGE